MFDMLTLAEFNAGGTDMTAFERRERLINYQPYFSYRLQLVQAINLDLDSEDGQLAFKNMNKQMNKQKHHWIAVTIAAVKGITINSTQYMTIKLK